MRIARLLTIAAATVALGASGCGGGGGAAKALAMLPADTSIVFGVDLVKLRASVLWSEGERLLKGLGKDPAAEAALEKMKERLKEIRKAARFDPFADVTSIVVGLTIDRDDEGWGMIVGAPDPSEKGLAKLVLGEDAEKDEIGGLTVYTAAGKGMRDDDLLALYVLDAKTFVLGQADYVETMAELHGGKGKSAADRKELAAAVKKIDGSAAAWIAAVTTEEIEEGLERGSVKHLDEALDVTASVSLAKGASLTAKLGFKKAEDAKDAVDALDEAVRDAKKSAREARERMPWVKDVFEAWRVEAKGSDAVVTMALSEEMLGDIAKWAKKDTTVVMSLLGDLPFGKVGVIAVPGAGPCAVMTSCLEAAMKISGEVRPMEEDARKVAARGYAFECEALSTGIVRVLEGYGRSIPSECPRGAPPYVPPPYPPPPIDVPKIDPFGLGDSPCKRYSVCIAAMGRAYRSAGFAGAEDAAKAMEDAAAMMEKTWTGMSGTAMDEGCKSGLDAMASAATSFEAMPGFKFPEECRAR